MEEEPNISNKSEYGRGNSATNVKMSPEENIGSPVVSYGIGDALELVSAVSGVIETVEHICSVKWKIQ
jgi:hypothetical protein